MKEIFIHLITSDNETIECESLEDAMFTARNMIAEGKHITNVVPQNNDVLSTIIIMKQGVKYV